MGDSLEPQGMLKTRTASRHTDLCEMTAVDLVRHYKNKEVSPVDVTAATLRQIERLNPELNAFVIIAADQAMEAARASEARWVRREPMGLVDGVPSTIKDLTPTNILPTRKGSRLTSASDRPAGESPSPARMLEHGAIILGKTTTPENGYQAITESPLTGISRNPWDPRKCCGGSSGGAAICAATSMGALHQGGDGGGSIRIPAALCGVFGYKPTYGRVSRYPHGPGGINMITHHGPITRTVADAALMMNVIAKPDDRDWHALPDDGSDYLEGLEKGIKGLRVAYSEDYGYVKMDPEIASASRAAVRVFEDLGAIVEECDPGFDDPLDCFLTIFTVMFDQTIKAMNPTPERLALIDPGLVETAAPGRSHTIDDLYGAWAAREQLCVKLAEFHQRYDLLISPQLATAAFDVGAQYPVGMNSMWEWIGFCYPFNLTQQPAATVPCGFTKAGLPIALQIVGPRFADSLVLRASRAFETVRPFQMPVR